jgi:hypothetical protein
VIFRSSLLPIAALLGIAAASFSLRAVAQESPELPSSAVTSTQLETAPQFYKGRGPGRGNSYVARYEEDWSYLRDPTLSTDPWFDPLKYIALDPSCDVYLTLNGEFRFRYDNTDHKNFGIAPSATPGTATKGPVFTPATAISSNELYKERYAVGADLHLGPYVRFYGELYNGQQTGHDAGDPIPGNPAQRPRLGEWVRRNPRQHRHDGDRLSRRPPGDIFRQRPSGARQSLHQPAVAGVRWFPCLSRLGFRAG